MARMGVLPMTHNRHFPEFLPKTQQKLGEAPVPPNLLAGLQF